ncbi:MAG: hypothetical protein A3C55_05380 [Gammaproteobacteria bacterium RIFCSPHIGHO2_02_FULL_42_13]|nr:MAG: hypothetical protein A3C55_05380 [Gammaproteobacteria bacterium RIFCSPHIGHO2_02_FULL_42_13]OGT68499.1 MAG: hypothetical protein A3H43_05870 [Gammaproteobacteria bacterium RIFCSPLOWO2_02_FULL_42_9]
MSPIIAFIILILGFVLLAAGANFLIDSGASLAKKLGVSALLIGLTIIAIGTSLPELMISFSTLFSGQPKLAIGNAIGSNITNIGLILGVTSLYRPLQIHSHILKKEFPLLFVVMLLVGLMLLKHRLDPTDGLLLLLGAVAVIAWFVWTGLKAKKEKLAVEYQQELKERDITTKPSYQKDITYLILGIILLAVSAEMVVRSTTHIANYFHISQLIIGLTIIALGTSLPELATSLIGAKKQEDDLVVGNIIGSNIFNLLAVLAVPVLFHSVILNKYVFYRDFLTMFGISIISYLFAFISIRKQKKLTRPMGASLIIIYATYVALLYIR